MFVIISKIGSFKQITKVGKFIEIRGATRNEDVIMVNDSNTACIVVVKNNLKDESQIKSELRDFSVSASDAVAKQILQTIKAEHNKKPAAIPSAESCNKNGGEAELMAIKVFRFCAGQGNPHPTRFEFRDAIFDARCISGHLNKTVVNDCLAKYG